MVEQQTDNLQTGTYYGKERERVYQDDIQSNKGRRLVGLPYSDVTNYLIIGCAGSIGIPEITEENYRQVFARHQFLQKDMVTLEQVKAHIGLKVNGSFEQLTSWRNRIARSKWCDIVYEIDKIK